MAISIVNTSGSAPISDGTSYTPSNTGTDQGVLSLQLYRNSTSGATSSDYQLNSVNFTQDQSILSQALISFTMYATAGYIPESSIPSTGTYDAKLSSAATGNGGLVLTVDGLTQSGTVVKDLQLNTFQSTSMPTMTYTATAGDIVVVGYESNGGTLTAPANASSGDSYVEQTNGALTDTPLSQGKIYTLVVTADMTSETVGNWLSGSNSGSCLLAVFSGTAASSGVTGVSALTLSAVSASAAGSTTKPTFVGTINVQINSMLTGLAGSVISPSFTGESNLSLNALSLTASGVFSNQAVTGASALTLKSLLTSLSGGTVAPSFSGSSAIQFNSLTISANGSVAAPLFSGSSILDLSKLATLASGAFVQAGIAGTSALALNSPLTNASGTFSVPSRAGTSAITFSTFSISGSGSVVNPGFAGTSNLTLNRLTISGAGAFVQPDIIGSSDLSLGRMVVNSSGVFAIPDITGASAITLGSLLFYGVQTTVTEPAGRTILTKALNNIETHSVSSIKTFNENRTIQ